MTQRSPIVVLILCCITFGIYPLVWMWNTGNEMNAKYNTGLPPMWQVIIPLYGILVAWKFASAVQKVSGVSAILVFLFFPIGAFLAQGKFNEMGAGGGMQQRAA